MAADTSNINANGEVDRTKKFIELGQKLKELREAQGISLEGASGGTKIQKKYISAIEEGALDSLPKGPYCRSFLRQYCHYLNAADMWDKYDPLTRSANVAFDNFKAAREEPEMAVTPGVFRRSPRFWIYLLVAASLAAAFWVTLRYRGEITTEATTPLEGGTAPIVREMQEQRATSPEAPAEEPAPLSQDAVAPAAAQVDLGWMDGKPQQAEQPAAQTAQPQQAQPQPAPAPATAAKEPVLYVTARRASWMRISSGGEVLYQGTLKAGEKKEFRVTSARPLRVRCGNPAGTEIAWFGGEPKAMGGGSNPVTRYYWSDGAVTESETR